MTGSHEVRGSIPLGSTKSADFILTWTEGIPTVCCSLHSCFDWIDSSGPLAAMLPSFKK